MFVGDFSCIKDSVYTDDGYTGTNFERPGFQKMIEDIDLGYISTVMWDGQVKVITGILLISVCSVSNHAADDAEPICPEAQA